MLTLSNIFIKYGDRILLDEVGFQVSKKDKIGLVGRNGAGKSTLLKIINGDIKPQGGSVDAVSDLRVGYLTQEIPPPGEMTVMEAARSAFDRIRNIEKELENIQAEMTRRTDYQSESYHKLLERHAALEESFRLRGGHQIEGKIEKVLLGLGFTRTDLDRPVRTFSGGWQMRVELAKLLLEEPDLLLLDEPTNHLDIESIIWLESYLKQFPGGIIIIAHDKLFLDEVCNRTIEVEKGNLYDYRAPYSKFLTLQEERREMQLAAYKNQQQVIAQQQKTINRFKAKATKSKMAKSMQKQLDKMDKIELDETDQSRIRLSFRPAPRSGAIVAKAEQLSKSYGEKKVLDTVDFQLSRGERVAFVGQNGQGKSTLVKLLVGQIEPDNGEISLGHNVEIGYYAQDQSDRLQDKLTVEKTLEQAAPADRQKDVRKILGAFLFSGEEVEKQVSVLSGGEKARLALAVMMMQDINFLVLDEPTNHLDIPAKEVLKNALNEYEGALIIVSHDRNFLEGLTSRTIEFKDKQLHHHLGDINEFLRARRVEDMRTLEKKSQETSTPSNDMDKEERVALKKDRKELEKQVKRTEKQIEKLEKKIQEMEMLMADPSFYDQENSSRDIESYKELKSSLEEAMGEWEKHQAKLDQFNTKYPAL